MINKHLQLVNGVKDSFLTKGFLVKTELPLSNGKGAVDIYAQKGNLNLYIEIKSSPASLNSKKASSQLNKYKDFFGKENIYCLVSPDSFGNLRIQSLDKKINSSFGEYLNQNV